MIIVLVLFLIAAFAIGFWLLVPLLGMVLYGQSWAKREAKRFLTAGWIDNPKNYSKASDILSKMPHDLEAADLWHKLQAIGK